MCSLHVSDMHIDLRKPSSHNLPVIGAMLSKLRKLLIHGTDRIATYGSPSLDSRNVFLRRWNALHSTRF